ncbi:MAG: hypothetical protein HND52_20485 [Ignavibacteriae bacterium]|nr:hypothetical protein [Ignavibacteriota bacterium]NOH00350.1 hypothetical protein [Ignavibacteriota bacterium]
MKRNLLLWVLSFILTTAAAVYQRTTGPTYPIKGSAQLEATAIDYKFLRSHSTSSNYQLALFAADTNIAGTLYWRRINSSDDWFAEKMVRVNDTLTAELPKQKAAGKLNYYIQLQSVNDEVFLPASKSVVIRFKGDVPTVVLIFHIIGMFGAMLLSTRTGLEYFNKEPKLNKLTYWTLGFLFVGGLILGPIVQKYAFDAYWTGFPFGHDLTDNKTAVAFLGWAAACYMYRRSKKPAKWALGAAVLLFIIYLIPHSVLGSELDYNKIENQKNNSSKIINEKL